MGIRSSSRQKGLKSRLFVDGSKYSSSTKLSGIGLSVNDRTLELDFKKEGILIRVHSWIHTYGSGVCWSWGNEVCQKGLNIFVALKGGSSWKYKSLSGLCGNLDGNASNDSPPALRSWSAIQLSKKEKMLRAEKAHSSMLSADDEDPIMPLEDAKGSESMPPQDTEDADDVEGTDHQVDDMESMKSSSRLESMEAAGTHACAHIY